MPGIDEYPVFFYDYVHRLLRQPQERFGGISYEFYANRGSQTVLP